MRHRPTDRWAFVTTPYITASSSTRSIANKLPSPHVAVIAGLITEAELHDSRGSRKYWVYS